MAITRSAEDIVRAVSRYLRMNPLASDTLEGIRTWWLPAMHATTNDLEQALACLEGAGVLKATRAADGRVHYRRAGLNVAVDAKLDLFIAGGDMTEMIGDLGA